LNVRPLAVFKQNVPIEAPLNDSAVMGEDVADSFGADVFRERVSAAFRLVQYSSPLAVAIGPSPREDSARCWNLPDGPSYPQANERSPDQ
jgi:hypothetical protein